ncbi:MAG TPA: sigma-70 family RNA polymerase sigma factor [Acidimicrobiales bacterium]|nr:sigma-70 family RNA polymerase sigma factor [Acidimicrobiales bacterium]
MTATSGGAAALEECFRDEWPRLVGAANRMVRDLGAAEEIVSDVLVAALHRWPFTGVPDRPGAWLLTATRNRARNHLRDRARANVREQLAAASTATHDEPGAERDDELALLLTCCHPALSPEAAVALTLRLVAGLSAREIARAFLVPVATIQQRIVRAKRTIASLADELEIEDLDAARARRPSAFAVIYLVFNEGYAATAGPALIRPELCAEALRLARLLTRLLPDDGDAMALLALLELQSSRLAARVDGTGDLVILEDQDRTRWDRSAIVAGLAALARSQELAPPGPLGLQAAIAAAHAQASSWSATDWAAIAGLYDRLYTLSPTPVVALNRAVAVAMRDGPEAGLQTLEPVVSGGQLEGHHLLWATRADLRRRAGYGELAAADYDRALQLVDNDAERRYLRRRLAELRPGSVA